MPQRIILAAIGFPREGKTVYPEIGKAFTLTPDELTEITKLEKASGNQLIRKLVNESGDEDLDGGNGNAGSTTMPQGTTGSLGQGNGVNDAYADKTVAQLKALAEERGVDLGDATRKDDIITVLKAAEAPKDEDI